MASNVEVPSENPGMFSKLTTFVFNRHAQARTDNANLVIALIAVSFIAICECFTLYSIFPLKTVKIYRLEVDKLGNEAVVPMTTTEYEPGLNEIRSRIKETTERMFSINARLQAKNLHKVDVMMSGQARKQFQEFLNKERQFGRVVEHPDLIREVEVSAVSKLSDSEKVLLVDFVTKERVGSAEPKVERHTITYSYEIKPAKTDAEVLGDNPAGIYIVSFTISDLNSN